ncbi:MAG: RHS repeat protein [Planctomyces sp.]|nr:RHS repeat protein [Planctomyces sp.]
MLLLRAAIVAVVLAGAAILIYPPNSAAQTIPYNWYTGGTSAGGGCTGSGYTYCISPDAACTGQYEYYLNHTFLSLGPGTDGLGKPAWVCKYIANTVTITGYIHAFCPSGYVQDIFAANGCVKGPVPKTQGNSCTTAGNPITVCTGNKYQAAVDFRSAGTNVLEFSRHYNSQSQYAGAIGISWQHNWERRLVIISSSSIRVIRPDGQELSYSKVAGNWLTWDKDVTLKLAASGSDYTLTEIDGTVETYDSAGKLQSIDFANGYTQTLTYTSGQLTEVEDNQDRTLEFTYDGNGNLDTMTDPDGNDYTYTYTDAYPSTQTTVKLLTNVTYPAASTPYPEIEYHYEDTDFPTYLTGITDELGERYATWAYDSTTGQTTSSEHAGGANATTVTYNTDGTKTVTYPLGEQIK